MSRSRPTNNAPSPVVRRFEWNGDGEAGNIRYYDKTAGKNIDVALPFTFILLDELATIGGYNEKSNTGIYSNEVRDTRTDAFVVKTKAGVLIEGLYKDIKDRLEKLGGHFVASCYIAFKQDDGDFAIGQLKLKGAALSAWMDFKKSNRAAMYDGAVSITGFNQGKKGKIEFRTPVLAVKDISNDSKQIAMDLDDEVQNWLDVYLGRSTAPQSQAEQEDPYDGADEPLADEPPF